MESIWEQLGGSFLICATTFISTTVMYWALILVLAIIGRRIKIVDSYYVAAFGVLIGAISARASLGLKPTMLTGLIALATLLLWSWVIKRSGKIRFVKRLAGKRVKKPVVVMINGEPQEWALRRYRIVDRQLYAALRQANIHRFEEVALVVFETKGTFTIMRHGLALDPRLFADVVGINRVPDELFEMKLQADTAPKNVK